MIGGRDDTNRHKEKDGNTFAANTWDGYLKNRKKELGLIMKRIFFLISITLLLFLVSSEADEIHLKNGRIIKLDSYWEENGNIVYEKFGATLYIDQNKIKKIIKESEEEISQRNSIEDEKLKSRIKKFNTNGGGVFLKNGKFFVATKTWYQDGLVYCETAKERLYFEPEKISQIAPISSKKSPPITQADPNYVAPTPYPSNKELQKHSSIPHHVARTPIIEVTNLGPSSSSEEGQSSRELSGGVQPRRLQPCSGETWQECLVKCEQERNRCQSSSYEASMWGSPASNACQNIDENCRSGCNGKPFAGTYN